MIKQFNENNLEVALRELQILFESSEPPDLLKKLRGYGGWVPREAADCIEMQAKRISELEEALREISKGDVWWCECPDIARHALEVKS